MPFDIPDNDVAFSPNQSIWMSADVDILTAGFNGVGVVDGCAVTAQGSPDMTVAIAAGNVRIASGAVVAVTAGNGTITTANGSNPRIDLVSVSESGTKTVTAGTAASSPKAPDLPSGHVALAMVYVPTSDTTIASNQITDKRVILSPRSNVQAFIGVRVNSTAAQSINDSSLTAVTFATESYDTDAFHDTGSNTSRLTVPTGLGGKYLIVGRVQWDTNSTGTRIAAIRLNGTTVIDEDERDTIQASETDGMTNDVSTIYDLAAGQYVELMVYQTSGGARTLRAAAEGVHFEMYKLDSGKVGSGIGAKAYHSTTQALTTATSTYASLDSEEFDTDAFHDNTTNNSRMTIPTGLGGKYIISGGAYFEGHATGIRLLTFEKNRVANSIRAEVRALGDVNVSNTFTISAIVDLVAGDYVEMLAYQDSGATVNIGFASANTVQTHLSIARLDSGTGAYTGSRWGSGTAFPSGPATNDRFTRTDLTPRDYYYDGTRWLSEQVYEMSTYQANISVTTDNGFYAAAGNAASSQWHIDYRVMYQVSTTHSSTQYWTIQLFDAATGAIDALFTTSKSGTGMQSSGPTAIGQVRPSSALGFYVRATKVSTPGVLLYSYIVRYRIIAT